MPGAFTSRSQCGDSFGPEGADDAPTVRSAKDGGSLVPRTRNVLGFVALLTAVGIAIVIAAMALREPGSNVGSSAALVYRVPSVIDEALPPRHALPFGL